jgi:hypothetical protein
MGIYSITEIRSQSTEAGMVCRLWRNYLLSGLAGSVFIVGCGHPAMRVYPKIPGIRISPCRRPAPWPIIRRIAQGAGLLQNLSNKRYHIFMVRCGTPAMKVYPKIPGTRIFFVGGQPSGRSCSESPWGQGSYRPKGVVGIIFSLLVVAIRS